MYQTKSLLVNDQIFYYYIFMTKLFRRLLFLLFSFVFFAFLTKPAFAIQYDLIYPTGELQRGQEVQFTINIDAQGATLNSGQIGMTYETQYLQYINTVPGDAMTSVSSQDLGGGKLLLTGSNAAGFTGQGVFATITLKIIADSPGETELCVLWAPSGTPVPTSAPTSSPYSTPAPTSPSASPPPSGNVDKTRVAGILGIGFLTIASGFYFFSRRRL